MFNTLYDNGYSPIPVYFKGKNPAIKEWQKYCHQRATQEQLDSWDMQLAKKLINVGVACGEASGIIVLDIDTDDKDFMNSLPPSPVRRRGQKGEARFFKYSPSVKTASFPLLDILSDGRQILVPPSVHPMGMQYEWLTPDTLQNTPSSELPELPENFLDLAKIKTKDVKIKSTGRNNKMVDIVASMRGRGEQEQEIIKQVYDWDLMHNLPRLFTDRDEGYKAENEADAKTNVWKFVTSVTKSLIDKGIAKIGNNLEIEINDEQIEEKVFSSKIFPEPTGLVADVKNLILDYSERDMPNIALGGAISLMSAICSNRFRFQQCWPNTYILNLAPTGAGKSFPQRIISMLLGERLGTNLIGFGGYHSSSAFSKNLVTNRERIDLIDEISSLFSHMKSGGLYQVNIIEEMCKVWSSSNGKYSAAEYSEKDDTGTCYNPCINILGSSTVEGMKQNITKMMVTKGLLPRFLIFSHENYGTIKNDFLNEELLTKATTQIKEMLKRPKRESEMKDVQHGPIYNPYDLSPTAKDAKDYFTEMKMDFSKKIENESSENMRNMLTRGKEQVMKLATIHAAGNFRAITLADLVWARGVFDVCLYNSKSFIEESAVDSEWERDVQRFLNLFNSKKFITRAIVANRIKSIDPQRLSKIVDHLIGAEKISHATGTRKGQKSQGWTLNAI